MASLVSSNKERNVAPVENAAHSEKSKAKSSTTPRPASPFGNNATSAKISPEVRSAMIASLFHDALSGSEKGSGRSSPAPASESHRNYTFATPPFAQRNSFVDGLTSVSKRNDGENLGKQKSDGRSDDAAVRPRSAKSDTPSQAASIDSSETRSKGLQLDHKIQQKSSETDRRVQEDITEIRKNHQLQYADGNSVFQPERRALGSNSKAKPSSTNFKISRAKTLSPTDKKLQQWSVSSETAQIELGFDVLRLQQEVSIRDVDVSLAEQRAAQMSMLYDDVIIGDGSDGGRSESETDGESQTSISAQGYRRGDKYDVAEDYDSGRLSDAQSDGSLNPLEQSDDGNDQDAFAGRNEISSDENVLDYLAPMPVLNADDFAEHKRPQSSADGKDSNNHDGKIAEITSRVQTLESDLAVKISEIRTKDEIIAAKDELIAKIHEASNRPLQVGAQGDSSAGTQNQQAKESLKAGISRLLPEKTRRAVFENWDNHDDKRQWDSLVSALEAIDGAVEDRSFADVGVASSEQRGSPSASGDSSTAESEFRDKLRHVVATLLPAETSCNIFAEWHGASDSSQWDALTLGLDAIVKQKEREVLAGEGKAGHAGNVEQESKGAVKRGLPATSNQDASVTSQVAPKTRSNLAMKKLPAGKLAPARNKKGF